MFYRSIYKLGQICGNVLENKTNSLKYLTEHDRWHIQISLCIERQPLEYQEPKFERLFREFQEQWLKSTGNSLKLPSLSTIEQKISHKIVPTREKIVKPSEDGSSSSEPYSSTSSSELESMLLGEFDIKALPRRSRRTEKPKQSDYDKNLSNDDDMHNIKRHPKHWLFFAIKYKSGSWSLPTTNLYFGDSVRETLIRLCEELFSGTYRPYFLGYCPFTHQKILHSNESEIRGKKLFYYRARHIPSQELSKISCGEIDEYAWCTVDELKDRLDYLKYKKVFDSLPLM
ncbi:hypothetical protein BEWA_007110 [Theileria equi strain WA]|uniref:Ribosomal protein L46 N-terminal domain-containing protein n=1 Tax=Theileria equi strain WA TaxID=1537102 RepID=L0B0B8_THEEQ|nr:hypothetical protein BEWA_007110 [Theileria equi strain WA]AFZ81302.1 hypothetical protein BEWA_007110 [Theileria equi strain WA]|eukprot:XP_004830968.1 hypothetical protein BEWA_007110 [Theileria equi strain WA]